MAAGTGVTASAGASVWAGSKGRGTLVDDRPRRRSLVCSLYSGFGKSSVLCLLEARLMRVDGAGGGDGHPNRRLKHAQVRVLV